MSLNEVIMKIVIPFLGGLGMFLFGMKLMSDNLEKIAGSKLRKMLDVITKNKFMGMTIGALFTMIIQSSSATTVMVVGFVNASLMNLIQATSVIMGANIGTTITAQLVAFKLTSIAPLFLFVGVVLILFVKKQSVKNVGIVLSGFGILFMGMAVMSSAMSPLRTMDGFTNIISTFDNPFLGVMTGAILTGVIQSSSASMGILQAMSMEGLIDLQGAIYIILGFNIGTCVTALLACIGANKTARRAAMIHLMFNLVGSLIFIGIVQVVPIAEWISASSSNATRQIANFHTIFNIAMTVMLLPFAGTLVWLSKRIIPGEDALREPRKLMYIEEHLYATPAILVTQVGKEVDRMAVLAKDNIKHSIKAFIDSDQDEVDIVFDKEEVIDLLNHEITDALVKVNHLDISQADSEYISRLFHVVSDLERIGDHAENIAEFAETRINKKLKYTPESMVELEEFSKKVFKSLDLSIKAFNEHDIKVASKKVPQLEEEIDILEAALRKRHIKRLKKKLCDARAGTIFIDILSNLERVADHSNNIASSILED